MNELIGTKVRYEDYLGMIEEGRIIAIELLSMNESILYDVPDDVAWVYIQHEDPEMNNKQLPDGRMYCEIRLSNKVVLI